MRSSLPLLVVVLLVPVFSMTGCKSTFATRTADLEEARARPAEGTALRVERDGETTYIDMRYYRGVRDNDGQATTVIVKDARPAMRYTGIALMAAGAGLVALGVVVWANIEGDGLDKSLGQTLGGALAVTLGVASVGGGLTLTIIGFVKKRPEVLPDEPGYHFVGNDATEVQARPSFWGVGARGSF